MSELKVNHSSGIVFYDGHCPLCHFIIRWLIKLDQPPYINYAPLQGSTARALLPTQDLTDQALRTVLFLYHDHLYRASDAAIMILKKTGLLGRIFAWLLSLWPRPIREALYHFIADHRSRWFGTYETCPLPEAKKRERFLA